jgi:heme-degrading monooxygenase HmoA
LIASYLLRNTSDTENYVIETVWVSHEALEKMRSENETPAAILAFQKVGVKPKVTLFEVINSVL